MDVGSLSKIGYGLYVLTTNYENIDNGCIINTVMQVTSEPVRLSIVVNKNNYTHELIVNSCVFNINVLTTETPFKVFEHFGFQSGRDVNKFADCEQELRAVNNVLYLPKFINAYYACRVVDSIDFGTHTMFIADILDAVQVNDKESVTYDYYQKNIKPKKTVAKGCWVCKVCGWVYEGEQLPDDIVCPLCKHGKEAFEYAAPTLEEVTNLEKTTNKDIINKTNKMDIQLAKDIYYVGVNDRHTEMFENHIELPTGVSYNSYLIVDERVALIDPVESGFMAQYLFQIKRILGDRKVDYLVVNHDEPDHSGSVGAVIREWPDVTVIGNAKTFGPLENFYGPIANKKIVAEGETLSLGNHTLQFFMAPMCHWPESMATYEQSTKIMFSNDAFGGFGTLNGGIFDDEVNLNFYEDDMLRYYANIIGKVAMMAVKTLQKIEPLDIKMIAPSHGLIWRSNLKWVLDRYWAWSTQKSEEGVVIVYGSMYGNTGRMADIVARGVADAGVKEIKVYDVSKTDTSFIFSDIWKYKGVVLGACSHYGSIFPGMTGLLHEITEYKPQNKVFALFGGASWSGGGLKTLKETAECCKWNVVGENIEVKGAPIKEEDIEKLYNLGLEIGKNSKI